MASCTPANVRSLNCNLEFTVEQLTEGKIKIAASHRLLSLGAARAPVQEQECCLAGSGPWGGHLGSGALKSYRLPDCRGYSQTLN